MKKSFFIPALLLSLFFSSCQKEKSNTPPIINSIELDSTAISPGGIINVQVIATDPDGDQLNYSYTVTGGSISGIGQNIQIIAPSESGIYNLNIIVSDGKGGEATGYEVFYVNSRPIINKITISPEKLYVNSIASIKVDAIDPDGDQLTYEYFPEAGTIVGSGSLVNWNAPNYTGSFNIEISVSDGKDTVNTECTLSVIDNSPPIITAIEVNPSIIYPGGQVTVDVTATDADGDVLSYSYTPNGGVLFGIGSSVIWTAPLTEGEFSVNVLVSDGNGGTDTSTGALTVINEAGEINYWTSRIIGSWNSLIGIAFGSTNGYVYMLDEAFANQSLVDFFYWWGASTSATIGAPDDANLALIYNVGPYALSNWTVKNATRFKTTTITAANFFDITYASTIIDIANGADQTRIGNLSVDQVIAFITVTNKHGLIHVQSVDTGSEGSITIDVKVEK